MKLIACYTVFDGIELLEKSINNIYPYVDGIVVCYQEVSNKGNKWNIEKHYDLMNRVQQLSKVMIVMYETQTCPPKENERRKHNMMVDVAKQLNGTHFLMMATDHFYMPGELHSWKSKIEAQGIDSTFTAMYTYYKYPEWRLTPMETYHMPFICKLHPNTKIERIRNFPVFVDPSVQMNTYGKFVVLNQYDVMLHHYSLVREDRESVWLKFQNAASPWADSEIEMFMQEYDEYDIQQNPGIKYFSGRKIVEVQDHFKLRSILK